VNRSLVPRVFRTSRFRYRHFVSRGADSWIEGGLRLWLNWYAFDFDIWLVKKLCVPWFWGEPFSACWGDASVISVLRGRFMCAVRGLLAVSRPPATGLILKTWVRFGCPAVLGGGMFTMAGSTISFSPCWEGGFGPNVTACGDRTDEYSFRLPDGI